MGYSTKEFNTNHTNGLESNGNTALGIYGPLTQRKIPLKSNLWEEANTNIEKLRKGS